MPPPENLWLVADSIHFYGGLLVYGAVKLMT